LTRRRFLGAATAGAAAVITGRAHGSESAGSGFRGVLCLFSKHLPDMDARQVARAVKPLGFAGVDLTVRP